MLLRSVSHELRTPINAISFLTQDLLENSSLSDETHEKLKIVNVSSQLLLNLVNDLLDYSRMLAGVFAINKCFFNIKDALENAIELIKLQAKKKNITLMLRIDPELNLLIYSDPFRLSQVLLNLLSNALKFTLKGSIEVICLSSCNQTLKIIIQDSGIGINSSKLEMLFEEFNTQNINMLNPQGAGLGLNISNKIVQKLGGTPINVDSSIGQGSEFSFVLDIAEDVVITEILYDDSYNSCTSENTTTDLSSLSRAILFKQDAKVLIVDDNDFNRAILVSILQKNNISYIEAYNGLEALNEVTNRKHNFKVIIMDGEMPVMDGWEASRKIHDFFADDVTSKAPVIIGYTAYTSVEDVNKFYLSKVSECVIKPCSPQKMLDTINKYL